MSTETFVFPLPEDGEAGPYTVVGSVRALPGKADALQQVLVAMVPPTREEEGALQYHVHRDRADPERFIFYEAWRSLEDLQRHLEMPHVTAFLNSRSDLIEGDLQVTWLKMESPYPG